MHLKNVIKIGEFLYDHFNIEDGRKFATFWCIMLYYFKKGKNATETQKKICVVYGKGAVTDRKCQMFCEVSWYYSHFGQVILYCGAVLCIGRCLAAPLASTQ